MLFVQHDVRLTQDGELPLDRTFKEKNNIYNKNQHNEFSLCDELITYTGESYRLWCVVVCDLETSRMRRPWPALGRSAIGKKNEFNKRVPLLHFVIRCPGSCSFSLVDVQFSPSSCVLLKFGLSLQNIKEF
jgi:hypothetical protein